MGRRVIIVGCGRVGATVAKRLLEKGDDVTVLDVNPDSFRRLAPHPHLTLLVGDGTSVEDVRRAGIQQADLFISLASHDTENALAAQMAQVTFRVKRVLCRMNDPVRSMMYRELGLRTLSPTDQTTRLVLDEVEH